METEFIPYERIGLLSRDNTRDEVKSILGGDIKVSYKGSLDEPIEIDYSDSRDIQIFYRDDLYIQSVEFLPGSQITIDNINFFNLSADAIISSAPKYWGKPQWFDQGSLDFKDVGIFLYMINLSQIETVAVLLDKNSLAKFS
jgi:hypothetical protein